MVRLTTAKELSKEVEDAVAKHQPELILTTFKNFIVLDGLFVVSSPEGPFDSFEIKVGVHTNFPQIEPIVFETANRIPKVVDRHIYPEEGNCCLGVWEEWVLTAPDHAFETFLTGILHDYFVSQASFEATGEWPYGERSHGDAGVVESFAELLAVEESAKVISEHLRLLSMKEIKGHHLCPCGSGKKLRECHRKELAELKRRIPSEIARRMLNRVAPKDGTLHETASI